MNPFDELRAEVNRIAWARIDADLYAMWQQFGLLPESMYVSTRAFRLLNRALRPLRYPRLPRAIRSHRARPRAKA
jgi:hypothetical protein